MIIYLDDNYVCHLDSGEGRKPIETTVFDDKARAYIEGYRYIPDGETWVRDDGVEFSGIMITPVADYEVLEAIQKQYEDDQTQMADMQTALEILGVSP